MTIPIAVVGGTGTFGRRIVQELLESPLPFRIRVGGRTIARFDDLFAEDIPDLEFQAVDLDDPSTLPGFLDGQKIVILAAGPFQAMQPHLARQAARLGVHYIDLADDPGYVQKMIALAPELERSGKQFLIGLGSLPGLSLRLADSIWHRFDRVDEISIGLFIGNKNRRGPGSVRSALEGLARPVPLIRGGVEQPSRAREFKRRFDFPDPIGPVSSFLIDSPDRLLFPASFNVNRLEARVGFEGTWARRGVALFKQIADWGGLGLVLRALPALLALASADRGGTDRGCVSVMLKGERDGGRLTLRASLYADKQGQRLASLPAVIAAEALAAGESLPAPPAAPLNWMATPVFLERMSLHGIDHRIDPVGPHFTS